jgi:hypothetical protein
LAYDPRSVLTSPRAGESYQDFVRLLRSLNGPVWAPTQGQLDRDYAFSPAAHWVALDDITRGPRRGPDAQQLASELMMPVERPTRTAYILASQPLDRLAPVLAPLTERYVLETDFGDRFEPLRVLAKRFDHGWPRYLYRHDPTSRQQKSVE